MFLSARLYFSDPPYLFLSATSMFICYYLSIKWAYNRRLDNLTADEISKNRLDSHWPLGVGQSELLFDGWL